MNRLYPHRTWLAALASSIIVLTAGDPLMKTAHDALTKRLQRLETEQATLTQALQNLHDDAATAEELSRAMTTDDVETTLAPVDRLTLTAQFEPMAFNTRLSRFTYTLSPPQPYKSYPVNADLDGLVESTLTVNAEAPHDGDVVRFIDNLLQTLPGRARFRHLTLSRLNAHDDASLNAVNLTLDAAIDWLANDDNKAGKP